MWNVSSSCYEDMLIKHWQLCYRLENHRDNFFKIWIYFDKYMPRAVSLYPECHMVIIWSKFWQVIQKIIKNQHCYFFNLTSMLLMIFYVKTCLEFLQELSYFNFFITGKRLTYLRKILWPLFMDGDQLPQCYSHFKEVVYFLPFSSQKFLVLISSTSEGWKAESTLQPPSGFEHGTLGLGIQCINH